MRTAVEISLIDPQVIEVQEISPPEILPDDKLFESLLIINQDEFNQIIKSYKLPYHYNLKIELYQLFNGQSDLRDRSQTKFNKEFTIDERPKKDDKDFKEYLQTKINAAFQNPQLIERYFEASDNAQITHDEGRDIHDGLHAARVALYSKMLLNLYRKYKDHFPENLQKEIEEFDERKEKDLEILCLMHDCARVDKAHDQNEYKNAFYAALIMRRLGDPRFSGDTISQEGLDLITNLSLKESEDKDKSLMSKLIQSADGLAITRVKKIIFDKDYIDATHDFYKIENSEMQSKILNEMNQLAHLIRYHEYINRSKQVKDGSKKLEFSENPYGDFKARIDSEQFLQSFELARDDLSGLVPVDSDKKIFQESYFVHVINTDRFSGSVLDKFNKKKFLNSTYILEPRPESKGAYIRHYANVGWYSHYFLIFNQNPDSGVVFLTGFQRDIGSDFLSRLSQDAQNDFELIKTFSQKAYSSFGYMVFSDGLNTLEEFRDKIHEIMLRKTDKELDISDQEYMVSERVDLSFFKSITKVEKIGKDRYNSAEFNMYKGIKIRNPQLIHNECHIYGAIHNVLYVGVAKDFLQDERMDSDNDFFGLKKIKTLMEAKEVSERINNEKRRLAELEEPIQDEGFKFCVNHEFRRIKTCLEKIIYLTRLRDEIRYGDHDIKDISMIRKERKQTATGQKFIDNHQNREIWRDLNIDKISRDLVVLYKELKSYESEESFGIKGLKEFVESLDYKDKKDSQQKINSWIDEIMDGKTQSHVIEKVVNKIKVELKQEVKVVSQDMRDPTNLVELDDDFLSIDKEFKRLKKELDRFNKDMGSSQKNKDDQDLVLFGIFLQHESQYIIMYKYFQDKEQREKLFSEYKKRIKVKPQTLSLDDLMLDKIIIKQDINVLLEILKNDYIDSNCLKNVSLIHVIESSSNIDKIKELLEVLKSKELENEINKKDQKGFTVLDKMLSKCSAKFVKEMLDLGFEISSKDKIEEILKSKKESLKKVIFENDKLRDSLTIESLKFDENYKSFFEKLANGDLELVEEVVRVFNDYAINKSPSYDLQFDDKKIRFNPVKLIEFIKESSKKEDIKCIDLGFGNGKVSSSNNIFEALQQKLTGDLKTRFNESFQKVNQPTSGVIQSGGVASLVFSSRPDTENSMT